MTDTAPIPRRFTRSFTQQEPIPDDAIAAADAVLRSGRLHRYNLAPGETGEVAALEAEFAALTGARYCLAVTSGGYAMSAALRALGLGPGDRVLSNGFTLAPVPGAIASVGAQPVFVDTCDDLTIDLADLATKATASGAGVLLLSHMRGHLCDMDRLMDLAGRIGLRVVEDCAHTMGAAWRGVASGRHGIMACYSTQTYKHINSGEGGLLTSDDPDLMARAILLSGSYMLYDRHGAAPPPDVFDRHKYLTPNMSGRMDQLRAAILRPQLRRLPDRIAGWNARYRVVEDGLRACPVIRPIDRRAGGDFVGSSIQFRLPGWSPADLAGFVTRCADRGVDLKWFGRPEPRAFTSRYDSWRFAPTDPLPGTDRVLADLMDMRLPLTFTLDDCATIAAILVEEAWATQP